MAFKPSEITKEHVLNGIKEIVESKVSLEKGTRWEVVIDGKGYPPKEVMRFARKQYDGSKDWPKGGGWPTNEFLEKMGFEVRETTNDSINTSNFDPYFNLSGLWDYQKVSGTNYNSSTKEAKWYYDTRKKLYYLITLISEELDEEFKLVYHEKPNAQKGRGKILFKDYILAGFAPKEKNIGDHLFIKISFGNIKHKPHFSIDLDMNFRSGKSKFLKDRNKIYTESQTIWEINNLFPNNWNNLLELILPEIKKLNIQFKKMTGNFSDSVSNKKTFMSLNQILYGPPGTGKTHKLQQLINDWDLNEKIGIEKDYSSFVKKYTWWKIIALALFESNNTIVPELAKHPLIIAKLGSSNVKQLNTRLWSSLQHHCVDHCENVKLAKRIGEKIFYKEKTSAWRLDDRERFEEEYIALIDDYKEFKNSSEVKSKDYTFTTCHQSLSYEDFIEGIKPDLNLLDDEVDDDKSKNLVYEIRKGIFYNACEKAAQKAGFINLKDCLDKSKDARKIAFEKAISENKIHVIFLDEINRCNVSAVFGELITLIEEDKRLGNENEIPDIILPYSQEEFGIPANLYIIGTMNTADRSVEALDTALRRRFSFVEMMPEANLITPSAMYCRLLWKYEHTGWASKEYQEKENSLFELLGVSEDLKKERKKIWDKMVKDNQRNNFSYFDNFEYDGINISELLENINKRIECLIGKDHTIGHSYFISVNNLHDLKEVFQNKIIPLLQEYFFGDYGRIGLVLGKGFMREKEISKYNNKSIFADFDTKNEVEIVKSYEFISFSEIDFKSAIQTLLA